MNSLSFFLHWLSDPVQVGALAPSGQALANLITAEIAPESAPVLELGPGSGAFTRALIDRGIPQQRLALVEESPRFSLALRKLFPDATVVCADAADLDCLDILPGQQAGAVVSGLPLLLMAPHKVRAILAGAFGRLRPDGSLYQFTYGSRPPVPRAVLEHLGVTATFMGRTLANVPPAAVYRLRRNNALLH